MNPISAYLVDHIVAVFFFYGLAFFALGLALLFSTRRRSEFRFAAAALPLALFGLLHGTHEWIEMFQRIAAAQGAYTPTPTEELLRVAVLAVSFIMLQSFAILLLAPVGRGWLRFWPAAALVAVWGLATAGVVNRYGLDPLAATGAADAMSRYTLGMPGAVMAAWALMAQQRHFRAAGMPQFGRDLVWCAAAVLLYGLVGQVFVRESALPFPTLPTGANFLRWFGIPVQVFRAAMAAILAVYMVRALQAFELEDRRRLEQANQAKLAAQTAALEAERLSSRQMAQLNEELRLVAHELSLLLDIANLLNAPVDWQERLRQVLNQIVEMLSFADAGLILFSQQKGAPLRVAAAVGVAHGNGTGRGDDAAFEEAVALGERSIAEGLALCKHADGHVIRFTLEEALKSGECRRYASTTLAIALPLLSGGHLIGSLVLLHTASSPYLLSMADLSLVAGIAQQLGASVDNAVLHQEARAREKTLAALLRSVVDAQESERQRIARELHDATGQSLTAVALGLRGIEMQLGVKHQELKVAQIQQQLQELQSFSTNALRELRQVIADLRPPQLDDLGLVAAMRWYIRAYQERRSLDVHFEATGDESLLSAEFKTVLFRIMQESLTNIAKHARAQTVEVCLAISPVETQLTIQDDGQGFDPVQLAHDTAAPQGWGLAGIRERAVLLGGQCTIDSAPGRGSRIHISAPLIALRQTAGHIQDGQP